MIPDPTYLRPETPPSPVILARALDLLGEPDAAPVLCGWWTRGEFGPDVEVDQAGATASLRRVLAGAPAEVLGDRAVLDVLALLSIPEGASIEQIRITGRYLPRWRWAPMLLALGVIREYRKRRAIGIFHGETEAVVYWLLRGRCPERHPETGRRCRLGAEHATNYHDSFGGDIGDVPDDGDARIYWRTKYTDRERREYDLALGRPCLLCDAPAGATCRGSIPGVVHSVRLMTSPDDTRVTVTRRPAGPAVD